MIDALTEGFGIFSALAIRFSRSSNSRSSCAAVFGPYFVRAFDIVRAVPGEGFKIRIPAGVDPQLSFQISDIAED